MIDLTRALKQAAEADAIFGRPAVQAVTEQVRTLAAEVERLQGAQQAGERERFEAWARTKNISLERWVANEEMYEDPEAIGAWSAWQARAALSAPASAQEAEPIPGAIPMSVIAAEAARDPRTVEAMVRARERLAEPVAGDLEDWLGAYWDAGYSEGKTGANNADRANEALHNIRKLFRAAKAEPVARGLPALPSPSILFHSDFTNQTYYGYTEAHLRDYGHICAAAWGVKLAEQGEQKP